MALHAFVFARTTPDRPAITMVPSGRSWTFREMEEHANRCAHLLRGLGLQRGDCVAAMLENCLEFFEIAWAADRAGIYFTTISSRLTAGEAEYIVRDSGAKAFFTSDALSEVAVKLAERLGDMPRFMAMRGGAAALDSFRNWGEAVASLPITPIADESAGAMMLYSSGSTGRPKGVKPALPTGGILTQPMNVPIMEQIFGAREGWTFLSPAPLYHAAPLSYSMVAQRIGCSVVVMERFDEEEVLRAIERYRVDIGQFVPTHFIRILKLPEETRAKYDISSLKSIFHAAAPCPVPVKEAMLDWWGPIIHEYYAGTEGNGMTLIGPEEWRRKKGSVGRSMGCSLHICDDDGNELPTGEVGQIFFSGGRDFVYHNDPEKTEAARHRNGWTSLEDVGWVDGDGYLFLTDRKTFMIISGGVNIYPQEIENLLVTHPKVADVAVIGAPDDEMGEKVVAVVQPVAGTVADAALAEELRLFCREHLSGVKTPRQFDFVDELPRQPTGKIYKRVVRDRYWPEPAVT
ncbi:MAG TPA: acyl-CoA synthetase [Sphingobium sp.]|uniref:acyl-CoA synthetase n=1 Tax=Sphingobium sp. TaxID=1912891 RepID=UPI002ED56713